MPPLRIDCAALSGRRVGPPPDRRRAALSGRRVGPPPDRRQTAPSLRLPLKGGVITVEGPNYLLPPHTGTPPPFHETPLTKLEYHSPLEGESQKPEPNGEGFCGGGFAQGEPRARSCAPSRVRTNQVHGEGFCGGGAHKASQRRDLVRRSGYARAKLKAKADAKRGRKTSPGDSRAQVIAVPRTNPSFAADAGDPREAGSPGLRSFETGRRR